MFRKKIGFGTRRGVGHIYPSSILLWDKCVPLGVKCKFYGNSSKISARDACVPVGAKGLIDSRTTRVIFWDQVTPSHLTACAKHS